MKVAVIVKRGHGAQDEGTHRVEASSAIEALREVLSKITIGKKWKPGTYISCVAFALSDSAEVMPPPSGLVPQCLDALMPSTEFPSLAAQAGATREAPTAPADFTCLSGAAVGGTLLSDGEEAAA